MPNEKVSQMTSLTAAEVANEDLLMIVDTSARESKKVSVGDMLTYIEATGSFNAIHAITSDTASYIIGSNVKGAVISSSFANTTISASNSVRADLARTASFALNIVTGSNFSFITGSTYPITASAAISSSYSVNSTFASSSNVALNLKYTGIPNGTASYAIMTPNADTASYTTLAASVISASYSLTSSYAVSSSFPSPIKAWAWVTWSVGVSLPQLYKQRNISQIKYLSTIVACAGNVNWHNFGVTFTNAIDTTDYMLDGTTVSGIYGCGFNAHVLMSPTGSRTVNGCTMSIAVDPTFTTYFTTTTGSATFEIYG